MARTPLLRFFERLVAERTMAEQAGVTVDELREQHARLREREVAAQPVPGVTRRTLLKAGLAAGLAASLGSVGISARPARAASQRVVIVGGGIAGLTAALRLTRNGVTPELFESAHRLGGRMHTDTSGYWDADQITEWCGETIDTGHATMRRLANRYGLRLIDVLAAEPRGSEPTYHLLGSYYTQAQADADFGPVYWAVRKDLRGASYPTRHNVSTRHGRRLDHMSAYEWIESRVPGGHGSQLGTLIDIAYNIEYGAETRDQSALNIVYLLGFGAERHRLEMFGESDERFRIDGGSTEMISAIHNELAGRGVPVEMGMRMNSIVRRATGEYALWFDGRSGPIVADQVVLALPFAVLRTLDYDRAGFNPLKKLAIENYGRGQNAKLHLQFDRRVWNRQGPWPGVSNGDVVSEAFQNTWDSTRGQRGRPGILVNYLGGNAAESLSPADPYATVTNHPKVRRYARRLLRQLEPVLPGVSDAWNGRATLSAPSLDPNLLLSYSVYGVGQYTEFGGYQGIRQGNVHFAGEHCSEDYQGYMEGGAVEGFRAASEILDDLS